MHPVISAFTADHILTAVPCELPHQEVCMYIPIAMVFLPFDSSCEHQYKSYEYEYIAPEQNKAGSEWRL